MDFQKRTREAKYIWSVFGAGSKKLLRLLQKLSVINGREFFKPGKGIVPQMQLFNQLWNWLFQKSNKIFFFAPTAYF
jgi:hypothetical protein